MKNLSSKIFLVFIFSCLSNLSYAQDNYEFTSATERLRFMQITKEIRCLVCQNQNIADSNAPLANDLRNKVYQMVLQKKSDTEIKEYMTSRFGDFILLRPPVNKVTLWLWLFPFIALILIPFFLYRYLAKGNP